MKRSIGHNSLLKLTLVAMMLTVIGCGGKSVKLVPAEGVVKLDGKPARGIMVQFMPDGTRGGSGPTSFGVTDEQGRFQLKTYENQDGATPGPHLVVLMDTEEDRPAQGTVSTKKSRLSSRFGIAKPGQLAVEVKEGGQPIEVAASAR